MRRAGLGLLVVVAGCGGGAKPTTKVVDNTAVEPTSEAAPCPADDVLLAALHAVQDTNEAHESSSIDACAPGSFGKPGWVIAARTESDSMDAEAFLFIIDADGALIAGTLNPEPIDPRGDGAPRTVEVADLDGDGVDEVLRTSSHHEATINDRWLSVYRIREQQLDGLGGVSLMYDEPDVVHCEATYEVKPPGIIVTSTGPDHEQCMPPGEMTIVYDGGQLDMK